MRELNEVLRDLLLRRGLTQKKLAEMTDLSVPSISLILQGKQAPQSNTLHRLAKALCETDEERMEVMKARARRQITNEEAADTTSAYVQEALLVGSDYMAQKSAAISFRNDIQAVLDRMQVRYRRDHLFYDEDRRRVTDFYLKGNPGCALEAKYGIGRDWERSLGQCLIIEKALNLEVLLCVPYKNEAAKLAEPIFKRCGKIRMIEIGDLETCINSLQAEGKC